MSLQSFDGGIVNSKFELKRNVYQRIYTDTFDDFYTTQQVA